MTPLIANTTIPEPATAQAVNAAPPPIDMWAEAHRLFGTGVEIFSRGDTLAKPDELVGHLAQLGTIWAIVFVIAGVACLLNGYRFYKIAVVGLTVLIGSLAGYWMGLEIQAPPFIIAGCVGLLLAVLAFPLMKYAVAVLGGLSGAFVGANLWAGTGRAIDAAYAKKVTEFNEGTLAGDPSGSVLAKAAEHMPADSFWIGALLGLIVCGIGAFVLFKISIHMFTSVSGATIAVFGVIALLLSIESFSGTVQANLSSSALVIPLLVLVPAAIGFLLQEMNSGAFGNKGGATPAT